jgi:DNA-binding MarR family transcriptional regulator
MYDLISFVMRGKIRKNVLKSLQKKPNTPTAIAHIINAHRSTTSRAILALEKKGLVKCITPDQKMCRFYQLTDSGKEVLENLDVDENE